MDRLQTHYNLQVWDKTTPLIQTGQWRGVPAKYLTVGSEEQSIEDLVFAVRNYQHVRIEQIPHTNLDGLLIALQKQGHFVSLVTDGQYPLLGLVRPDWIVLETTPNDAHEIDSGVLHDADEFIWTCETWNEQPLTVFNEILTQSTEDRNPRIPVFYFDLHPVVVAQGWEQTWVSLPLPAQSFWRIV